MDNPVSVTGIDGLNMQMDAVDIAVNSGEVMEVPVRVNVDPVQLEERSSEVIFHLNAIDDPSLSVNEEARFLGPRK